MVGDAGSTYQLLGDVGVEILHVYWSFLTGSYVLFWFNFQILDDNICVLMTPSCKVDDFPPGLAPGRILSYQRLGSQDRT